MATFITLTSAFGHRGTKVAIKVKTIIAMEQGSQWNEYKNPASGLYYFTIVRCEGGEKFSVEQSIERIQAEILLQKQLKKKQ